MAIGHSCARVERLPLGDSPMPTTSNKPTTRFLGTLRDVLFETTPNGPAKVSGNSPAPQTPTNADFEAARAALRQSVEESLGPGTRELTLQVEALREALPDARQRLRAALRVLSLKGFPAPALVAELEQAIAGLTRQNEAFSSKLSTRRAAVEDQRQQAVEACRVETEQTEQAIVQLQAELEAARAQLAEAAARREQALATCDEHATRLAAKQQSFERAFGELHGEYATLTQQLSNAESV
jgi:chromosome segregation ATPase